MTFRFTIRLDCIENLLWLINFFGYKVKKKKQVMRLMVNGHHKNKCRVYSLQGMKMLYPYISNYAGNKAPQTENPVSAYILLFSGRITGNVEIPKTTRLKSFKIYEEDKSY